MTTILVTFWNKLLCESLMIRSIKILILMSSILLMLSLQLMRWYNSCKVFSTLLSKKFKMKTIVRNMTRMTKYSNNNFIVAIASKVEFFNTVKCNTLIKVAINMSTLHKFGIKPQTWLISFLLLSKINRRLWICLVGIKGETFINSSHCWVESIINAKCDVT